MASRVVEIFEDKKLVEKIKCRLPELFQLANMESSRAGKTGMQAGSVRENIIVALLIYKFGEENVDTNIPITAPEADARLFGVPISIKTLTGKELGGVKLVWTVDPHKAREFRENYAPRCDMLLVRINWGSIGAFYYIPLEVQKRVFKELGREGYIKLPKEGTNPRGVEITKEALSEMVKCKETKAIEIQWWKTEVAFNPYKRWVDYWREEQLNFRG